MNATRKPQTHRKPVEAEPVDLPDGAQTDGTPNRRPDGAFKDTPEVNPAPGEAKG